MFWVYFTGTRTGAYVQAATPTAAKWLFAMQQGVPSIVRISARKIRGGGT